MSERFPMPPYPNGWYQVLLSRELPPETVRTVRYFGRELVLFRGADGRVGALDAFCPHMGSHLGEAAGGRVCGTRLQCPFHGWQWNADGTCGHIPYSEHIPPQARARTWPVDEVNDIVFLWFHDRGEAPDWRIAPLLDVDDAWTALDSTDYEIACHPQVIGENVTDLPHLVHVHGQHKPEEGDFRVAVDGPCLDIQQRMRLGDGPLSGMEVPVATRSCGPGIAQLHVDVGPVTSFTFINQTPIEEDRLRAWVNFRIRKLDGPEETESLRALYSDFLNEQFQQDIPIWDRMRFATRPNLCRDDGPIFTWRTWYTQFYSNYDAARAVYTDAGP